MNNGFVCCRPCGDETGKLCIDAVALQDIGCRYRFAALLIGYRPLCYRPVNASNCTVGFIGHILEAAVYHRLERIKPVLRSVPWPVPALWPVPAPSISQAWSSL